MTAFDRLIPAGEQIPYFIYFNVNPEDIDVNIHPTKTEIKFENEQTIWQILSAAVKDSLGKFNDIPSIDFDTEGKPDIPVFNPSNNYSQAPELEFNPDYNPFNESEKNSQFTKRNHVPHTWDTLYEGLIQEKVTGRNETYNNGDDIFGSKSDIVGQSSIIEEKSPVHYQYKGKYIITAVKSGLMIIDQNRAHTRILYDKYLNQIKNKNGNSQQMLFPEMVQFSPSESIVLEKISQDIEKTGFELTPLGGGSYSINGVPAGLEGIDYARLLKNIVDDATEENAKAGDGLARSMARQMARTAAIPYGQVLGNSEMENLINELFACSNVNYTPDGKSIISILKQQDIEHLFG